MDIAKILNTQNIAQVAVIVEDVVAAKQQYAKLFGMEVPPTVPMGFSKDAQVETHYMGQTTMEPGTLMAFFWLDCGIQFEIIQPNEAPSVWRDFLNETGGGLHHIAFRVKDMKASIAACEELGMTLTQYGDYADKTGEYAYLDARKQLKCYIELLLDYDKV